MLRLLFVMVLFTGFDCCLKGQSRKKTGPDIWIEAGDLKANKVYSITFTNYKYISPKDISKKGIIDKVELYDSLGRNTETRFYNDSTGQLSSKHIAINDDTSRNYHRIEWNNDKDSLVRVTYPKDMVSGKPSMAFGYYKYEYGKKGLISEAVYYNNECGSCSKPLMKPIRLIKLKYTFYPRSAKRPA